MSRPAASVTVVVSTLFALVSFALFASIAAYLYFALRVQLQQRDAEELRGKLALIRELAAGKADAAAVVEDAWHKHGLLAGHERLHLVVRHPDGRVLIAHHGEVLDGVERVPAAMDAQAPVTLFDHSGMPYLVLATEIESGSAARPLRVELAISEGVQLTLLASFRRQLVAAVLGGSLLAGLLGWGAARYGMRPLRRIAHAAARISVERLGERIDPAAAPRELQDLVAAFNGMLERLETSFRRLEEFSSDLAHELRTPINNIMLQTEVALARPRSPDDYARLLESIQEECQRLSRMSSDMLFLAKADSQQLLPDSQFVSLREECEKAVAFFQPLLDDNGVASAVEGEAEVRGNPLLIRRAIVNLLSNAARYTPRGGVIRILVSTASEGAVQLDVSNPGPGIAPEHLKRVFERFFRADPARGRSPEGAGLGLPIVAAIMGLHGGTASARSVPGVETTFSLRFPSGRGGRSAS